MRSFFLPFLLAQVASSAFAYQQGEGFQDSFSADREYFILRSGKAKLILQSDRSGVQPAFTFMLFDAEKPCQTLRKERAFNFSPGKGCSNSALVVLLGKTAFTAFGHTTEVHWTNRDGIPAVEARWWVGGLEVQESFTALEGANAFIRAITLRGKDNAGPDTVRLRLSLPEGRFLKRGPALLVVRRNATMAIAPLDGPPVDADEASGLIETSKIIIYPGSDISLHTLLLTRIPARGSSYDDNCGEDMVISPKSLTVGTKDGSVRGLRVEYFSNPSLRGKPSVTLIDTNLSPYWDVKSPEGIACVDSFSVRWSGTLLPPSSGKYRFSLVADDRARLFINNRLLIDCWENAWNVTRTAEIRLRQGTPIDIRLEFAELTGWAGVRLKWSPPARPDDEHELTAGMNEVLDEVDTIVRPRASRELNRTKASWASTNMIETGDTLVRDLFRNSVNALPGMVAENGRMDAGIFEYGTQWVRDGSNVALGLIHGGHFEAAKALLTYILIELVSADGKTVIAGGYDGADREELDQMGELMHSLKAYRDWTGDTSLIWDYRSRIIAMIERPLLPMFRDTTGMVHNRREFWERTLDDGYELAYQTYLIQGLRDAADLSAELGVPGKARHWREQADLVLGAMLHHPTRSLVEAGSLVKRRNVDGGIAAFILDPPVSFQKDDPYSTEAFHRLEPDASYALPIHLGIIDPSSDLSLKTLEKLESIWNARWSFGGYERYHSSSQQDQPGPWSFSTAFIARAQHDAGLFGRSRRALEWLSRVPGGNAGAWYEEIPLIRSQVPTAGIVPWASAEVATFVVRHWLGLRFDGDVLVVHPKLFPGDGECKTSLRFRSSRFLLRIDRSGAIDSAFVNGMTIVPDSGGAIRIPVRALSGEVNVRLIAKQPQNASKPPKSSQHGWPSQQRQEEQRFLHNRAR